MNQNFQIHLYLFKDWLERKAYSQRTIADYPHYVGRFLEWMDAKGVLDVKDINRHHLISFQRYLMSYEYRGRLLSQTTIRMRLGMIKTFFLCLRKLAKVYHDPSGEIELPKRAQSLPRNILEVDEVMALLQAPDCRKPLGIRDRALLEMLYATGLRNAEIRGLQLEDVHWDAGEILVKGKGGKEALLPLLLKAKSSLRDYLLHSRPQLLKGCHGGKNKRKVVVGEYLFLTVNGYPLNESDLWSMVKKYSLQIGLQKQVSPHGLRHSCATHLLQNGADIRMIQQLLRHACLDTTQIYTRVSIEDLKKAQKRFHPLERGSEKTKESEFQGDDVYDDL